MSRVSEFSMKSRSRSLTKSQYRRLRSRLNHWFKGDERGRRLRPPFPEMLWNPVWGFLTLFLHFLLKSIVISLEQGFPTFLWRCTPSAFRQISMYPSIRMTKRLSNNKIHWNFNRTYRSLCLKSYFNNKPIMIFENNIHWYINEYLEINNI